MKDNKNTFIVDNFIEVIGGKLDKATSLLNAAGVLYIVEPWGSDDQSGPEKHRVYVRKDVSHVLEIIEKGVKKDDPSTDGIGVPKQGQGAI